MAGKGRVRLAVCVAGAVPVAMLCVLVSGEPEGEREKTMGTVMIPEWHRLACRAALAIRRHGRDHFPENMRGACCLASVLLAIAYEARGIQCAVAQTKSRKRNYEHAWVEVGGQPVDITATQFGFPEFVRLTPISRKPARRDAATVSLILHTSSLGWQLHPWSPHRRFDLLVPALADVLQIEPTEALRRVRAFVGPEASNA